MAGEPPQPYAARLQELVAELGSIGLVSPGSVSYRHMSCGKPGCRCQADPPQLHGPYWQWSRSVAGRTVSRHLSERQARLYQEWVNNRRRLAALIAELEEISAQAIETILQQTSSPPQTDALTTPEPRAPARSSYDFSRR
jgi:uncharacterized protein DUF6788